MDKKELLLSLRQQKFSDLILNAFENVKREDFIPFDYKIYSYYDHALPTSEGQTISQPSCIAMMLDLLELDILRKKEDVKILEIGSGTGYVLSLMNQMLPNAKIIGIEIKESLAKSSKELLKNNKNIEIINKSGFFGYKKAAPYDRIIVSASAPDESVLNHLTHQLKEESIILSPVGYDLVKIKKNHDKVEKSVKENAVMFVPLVK